MVFKFSLRSSSSFLTDLIIDALACSNFIYLSYFYREINLFLQSLDKSWCLHTLSLINPLKKTLSYFLFFSIRYL